MGWWCVFNKILQLRLVALWYQENGDKAILISFTDEL